ncbi:IS5/IS1182 family transposase [Methylocella silvestris]|uniref:IS5/IS1182 family transposase n=1 Tax=Methylocella silvestris TaxID=199596 RepID=A0A2J7TFR6_METSI|nr:IS5/IS1182 family transposase [Methylocella silvestris]
MILDQFWLTDAQFSKIAPHLPTDTRGKARVDDRRVISGIVHVLKSGGRWIDAPPEYGPKKTLYNRYVRWAAKGVWVDLFQALAHAGGPPAEVLIDSSAVKAHRSASGGKGGEKSQAIGRSRGGRTTKIHALTDANCRPIAFILTGGNVADCTAGAQLLARLSACEILHGDKGYDSNAIRRQVEKGGAMPNIPPKANRKWKNCFSPYLYRNRNAIERMFCRLKDFRRVATRYDRNAANFLAAVCIAATVSYWL